MRVKVTLEDLIMRESSIMGLVNRNDLRAKFALMVGDAVKDVLQSLREYHKLVNVKQKEYGQQDPDTGMWSVKPGSPEGAEFMEEMEEAVAHTKEYNISAIPLSEFKKYIGECSPKMILDLIGLIIDDGNPPLGAEEENEDDEDAV